MSLSIGAATKVINGEIGDDLLGQLHRRLAKSIRDNLEANALYVAGETGHVLLISCDLLWLEAAFVREVAAAIAARTGVAAEAVVIACTHTHDGPNTFALLPDAPVNEAYLARLRGWLVEVAERAVRSAGPGKVGWALGRAHVGFNRRLCWADGTHSMYGDPSRKDFNGLEGPEDPRHSVLAAYDAAGKIIAVVHNNSCHATCIESAEQMSADFPGEARRLLRQTLGDGLPVLYLQGASGDNSPFDLQSPHTQRDTDGRERRLREVGMILAGETLRLLYEIRPADSAAVACLREDLRINVRLPDIDRLEEIRKLVESGPQKAGRGPWVLQSSLMRLVERFRADSLDVVPVSAVRIGELGIATNPCEFYCQFGLDIKRRSPAAVTMVSQLTNGCCGYCPTPYAVLGGGYSGDATLWCRLEPFAGYRIVDAASRLLRRLW